MKRINTFVAALAAVVVSSGITITAAAASLPQRASERVDSTSLHYRSKQVEGIDIFYREAGPDDAPVVVLLHGFPTSSAMYRNLIPALAARYHVIAPDYPGFGNSAVPDRKTFSYSFEHFAAITDDLLTQLGAKHYALYVQDYGAPVGYRLALRHPERVSAIVVQNGNAYEEGIANNFWTPLKAWWANDTQQNRDAMRAGLTAQATKSQYLTGVSDPSRVDPDTWLHDQTLLDRPGVGEIMLDLFKDYGSNVALYPKFHAFFRERQPPMLIVWGKNDVIFPAEGARPYLRDLPKAELHLLDTGHFALEDKGAEIARLMGDFLDRAIHSH
jgi:pimeloyl-ACP methyl ester carboxylesterase